MNYAARSDATRCAGAALPAPSRRRCDRASRAVRRSAAPSLGVLLIALLTAAAPSVASAASERTAKEIVAAVVAIDAVVPESARTAGSLGTQREGSGVIIDDDGLVLTIGYLILEASSVTLIAAEREIPATVVGYDHASGFGLVRATEPLPARAIGLGNSSLLERDDPALVVSSRGSTPLAAVRIADRRTFAGYWEYLLEDAIFTAPPLPEFAGAALVSVDGELVGIGSLVVPDAGAGEQPLAGNMFVPIDALKPILGELRGSGRSPAPPRPWLGMFTAIDRGHLFVTQVAQDGPAQRAGIEPGDIVIGVGGERVTDMESLYRKVWALGAAGTVVPLRILRNAEILEVDVISADRYQWLRLKPTPVAAGPPTNQLEQIPIERRPPAASEGTQRS